MKSWALVGIVLTLGIGVAACSSDDNSGSSSGSGGSGGSGSGSNSGGSPTSTTSTSSSPTSTTSTSSSPTSTTNTTATTSSGPGMTCDDIGVCQDDDQDPTNDCVTCAIIGDDVSVDGAACQDDYVACFGTAGDCSDGDVECCGLNDCINACPTDPAAQLDCICTNDGTQCTGDTTDPNTCFGQHPEGIEPLITILSCLFTDTCPNSCPSG